MPKHDYLRALKVYWPIVLVTAVLTTGLLFAVELREPDVFKARTSLTATFTKSTTLSPTAPLALRLKQRQTKTFCGKAMSLQILGKVIESLDLPYSYPELLSRVQAWSPVDSYRIEVVVTDTDAERASDIANTIAEELVRYVAYQVPDKELGATARLTQTDVGWTPSGPEPVSWATPLFGGSLGGGALGLGLAVVLMARADRRRTRPDEPGQPPAARGVARVPDPGR
ncbi:hypothetical protein Lfu02_64780 [Longispora fulva]|uniref:Capsular polysaccharide biosynthesis protein n=1 Tax=Longispora fulva TaxID=619741 RepID=A0A8J7GJJ6_9ACTN|nr:hypothetical protein [Longispora fulva]MBG6137738.1 capsular polysaccharide biosynthesis protein [Longispora fulva]GIG62106.1 hypothetical protein Lfu02_64780 [Longispora fulva]